MGEGGWGKRATPPSVEVLSQVKRRGFTPSLTFSLFFLHSEFVSGEGNTTHQNTRQDVVRTPGRARISPRPCEGRSCFDGRI